MRSETLKNRRNGAAKVVKMSEENLSGIISLGRVRSARFWVRARLPRTFFCVAGVVRKFYPICIYFV